MNVFDLNEQWLEYLRRVGLDESKMPALQKEEMKKAYLCGCGQMLMIVTNQLAELEEPMQVFRIADMINQVKAFLEKGEPKEIKKLRKSKRKKKK